MTHTSSLLAALDIGGTKIAAAFVDPASGEVKDFRQVPTEAGRGGPHVVEVAARLIAEMMEGSPESIAIGICEIVDHKGQLRSKSAIDWMNLDLQRTLKTDLPIHLVSDVRAAALAETRFGAAKNLDHVLYISIGTGISSTLLINGLPYAGAHGAALVLSSAESEQHCVACGAVTRQTLEHVASGAGLEKCYGKHVDAKEIIRRAGAGDTAAMNLLERATRQLGGAIAQLSNCTDPQAIIIGGGLGSADGIYWDLLHSAIEQGLWSERPASPILGQSKLGADRGIIGAALAAVMKVH